MRRNNKSALAHLFLELPSLDEDEPPNGSDPFGERFCFCDGKSYLLDKPKKFVNYDF